jgi:hypothetical protein
MADIIGAWWILRQHQGDISKTPEFVFPIGPVGSRPQSEPEPTLLHEEDIKDGGQYRCEFSLFRDSSNAESN